MKEIKSSESYVIDREGLFAYIQKEILEQKKYISLSTFVKQNFIDLRIGAEQIAQIQCLENGIGFPNLNEIYDALKMTGEITDEECSELLELENRASHKLGISGLLSDMNDYTPNAIERYITNRKDSRFVRQLMLGVSRKATNHSVVSDSNAIGATLGGPILVPYVRWILEKSIQLGITRLYFIARDGYILMKIAAILIEKMGIPINVHYIYGSRRAWRMPSYEGNPGELRDMYMWSYAYERSVAGISKVIDAPVEITRKFLPKFYVENHREHLTKWDVNACVQTLDSSSEFRQVLSNYQHDKKVLVCEYIQQEIDTSDANFAFVELSGSGFTQKCLAKLMRGFCNYPIRTFFFKMERVGKYSTSHCMFYTFFPGVFESPTLIEMLCRSYEGQTLGYRRDACSIIMPEKSPDEYVLHRKYGYDEYVRGILKFAEIYAETIREFNPNISLSVILDYWNFIFTNDGKAVLDYFASMPNSVNGFSLFSNAFAPQLDKKTIRNIFLLHTNDKIDSFYKGTDLELSIKRSSDFIQHKVEFYRKNGFSVLDRWKRFVASKGDAEQWNEIIKKRWKMLSVRVYGKKIVLYGGGLWGQRINKYVKQHSIANIVQWLDKDYRNLRSRDVPVSGDIENLGEISYDFIIISIGNKAICAGICLEMEKVGVECNRIIEWPRLEESYDEIDHYM